jgi:hypothetical protein
MNGAMHYLSKTDSQQAIGFVTVRCPKCHRLTSSLSVRTSPKMSCKWTDCGYSWIEQPPSAKGLSIEDQRAIARAFYALRAAIWRDPEAVAVVRQYEQLQGAYVARTGTFVDELPEPGQRRRWINQLFLMLLQDVNVDVWTSTQP